VTWAKLDDRFHQDPQLLRLPRGVRLLYVEGLAYCAQQLTDGFIADYMLRKITDEPDPEAAAAVLVEGELWESTQQGRDSGWNVREYLTTQSSREDVERSRAMSAETTARSRRHKAGDHSTCTKGRYCPEGQVTRQHGSHSPSQSGLLDPTLSDPTPREGQEGRDGAAAPAPWGSQAPARRRERRTVTIRATDENGEGGA
jgi:hypothetical protein